MSVIFRRASISGFPPLSSTKPSPLRSRKPVSFSLKVDTSGRQQVAMANLIRDDLQRVGILVVYVPLDFITLVANFNNDFQFDFVISGMSFSRTDPSLYAMLWKSAS